MDTWDRHCLAGASVGPALPLAMDLPQCICWLWYAHDAWLWIWLWNAYADDGWLWLWVRLLWHAAHVAHSAWRAYFDCAGHRLAGETTDDKIIVMCCSPKIKSGSREFSAASEKI